MIDPTKLIASATRLYQDDMARLWGEILPVPAARVRALGDADRLSIAGHEIEAAWTPGHAWHHVSYFLPAARIAFVGDTAGLCRPSGRLVIPPTPPPDIDLEAWQESTRRILAWEPDALFLTHFGPEPAPRVHFQDLWRRIEDWSARVRASLDAPGTDAERAARFQQEVADDITCAASREEAQAYARAGRFDYSWTGLARYWRKKLKG
jgi:glyoxylase-like metal-dependent hydrolase (beta-lactamase superfamily II)